MMFTYVLFVCRNKVDLTKYLEEHIFSFDNCFDEDSDNIQIYNQCVRPLVQSTF